MSSYGMYSLEKLTDVADGHGVDVIFLTDNLTDTIQYGLPPLRNIFWMDFSRRSVLSRGAGNYLDAIAKENARQSDVLYVPGVEVCPRFYWTGSLRKGDLVCHDHQRNIIVLGCDDPDIIANIPETRGFTWPRDAGWIIGTRLLLFLLVVTCCGVVCMPRFLARRSPYSKREIRRSMVIGLVLPVVLLCVVVDFCAARVPSFRIYGRSGSWASHRRTIDYLRSKDLVHYWAHPEAVDHHDFAASDGPAALRLAARLWNPSFAADTRPYPEALKVTSGYSGFGGIYEDANTLLNPGSAWDAALREYTAGKRKHVPLCFGEMLYHYEGQAGKRMRNVETMVWAADKRQQTICLALGAGRFYARRNRDEQRLVLDRWEVGRNESGVPEIRYAVSSAVPGEDVTLTLVKDGAVADTVATNTPVAGAFMDESAAKRGYYRLVVRGRGLRLAANPLFVK